MANQSGAALQGAGQGASAGAAMGPWGALIGAGVGALGGIMGGNAAENAANKAAEMQRDAYEKNKALLESVGIPSIEAQEIALNNPEYAGELVAEILGESEMQDISLDPQLRQNQMNVLAELQGLSETGLGVQDRIALDQMQSEIAGQDQSRQAAILQGMAERGNLDSGAQLAAQLQSRSAANQSASDQGQAMAVQAQNARMNAMNQLANMSGNMEAQDFSRQAQQASAADEIQRFNAANRQSTNQYNLGQQQSINNQTAANQNQQEIYNKGLLQQDYQNRLGKAQNLMGLNTNNANNQAQFALQKGQGQAQMYQGVGQGVGNAINAYSQYDMQNKK